MHHSIYQQVAKGKKALLEELKTLSYPKEHKPPYTEVPFGEIFQVWAQFALDQLHKTTSTQGLSESAVHSLKRSLIDSLSLHCSPTFGALLQVAKIDGKLRGNTPKERYLYYVEHVFSNASYLTDLFSHFPPLASKISALILLWIDQAAEFLDRLEKDRQDLAQQLDAKGRIVSITSSLSDPHNGNRSVYKLVFENGTKLIYKPKSMSIDAGFNRFLESVPGHYKSYQILDRLAYGWAEFVEIMPCQSLDEVKRYFDRLGGLICLMYVLEGTDCHYENLLAHGEFPILIDLESLFHPSVKREESESTIVEHTVFRTGFLPGFGFNPRYRIDFSPLTGEEVQEVETPQAEWKDVNTDQMQFHWVKRTKHLAMPRPKFEGKIVAVTEYVDDLLAGFEKMYRYVETHKQNILTQLESLFSKHIRFIFRPTQLYFDISRRLTDPKVMQSEELTEEALDVLSRFSIVKNQEQLKKIVQQEKESLKHGDLPFFLSSPSDTNLYVGNQCVVQDFFKEPSKKGMIRLFSDLSKGDLIKQKEFIEYSLYFLKIPETNFLKYSPYTPKEVSYSDSERLQFAKQIGEKILSDSFRSADGNLAWISLEYDPLFGRYVYRQISSNFYSGTIGISLFFAALGCLTNQNKFIVHSEENLERIKKAFIESRERMTLISSIGGMFGMGGMIYVFTAIGKILKKKKYWEDALYLTSLITKEKIKEDVQLDLVGGAAGLILALLFLYRETQDKSLLSLAEAAGQHLLDQAKQKGEAATWETPTHSCLCGLSHGASGIALALFKLYEVTKKAPFLEAAKKGLLYERGLYSSKDQNWPDLRFKSADPDFTMKSWCHGAPGIGFARFAALKICPDPEVKKELDLAVRSTMDHFFGYIDHLCCGNFGKIAFLHDSGNREVAQQAMDQILQRYSKEKGFRLFHNLTAKVQSPSFMQGLSGIGYEILRQTKVGANLPQPLVLE